MKYPVTFEQMSEVYKAQFGEEIEQSKKKFYSSITDLMNMAYEDGKRDTSTEVKQA